jgi:hypothetical protein
MKINIIRIILLRYFNLIDEKNMQYILYPMEKQFTINSNIFDLEFQLENNHLILIISFILYSSWYALSISLPIIYPGTETVQWTAHYIYAGYMLFIFIIEMFFSMRLNITLQGNIWGNLPKITLLWRVI